MSRTPTLQRIQQYIPLISSARPRFFTAASARPLTHYISDSQSPYQSSSLGLFSPRSFSTSSSFLYPRKDSQDKDSINAEAAEYTKSGTDDSAAREQEAAFDPNTTRPEEERKVAKQGSSKKGEIEGGNPLDISPANPEVSKQRDPQEGGAERSAGKKSSSGVTGSGEGGSSGFGSPKKGGKRD